MSGGTNLHNVYFPTLPTSTSLVLISLFTSSLFLFCFVLLIVSPSLEFMFHIAKGLCCVYCSLLSNTNRAWDTVESLIQLLKKSMGEGSQHLPFTAKKSDTLSRGFKVHIHLLGDCGWDFRSVDTLSAFFPFLHPFLYPYLQDLVIRIISPPYFFPTVSKNGLHAGEIIHLQWSCFP